MKNTLVLLVVFSMALALTCYSQGLKGDYLGQDPPDDLPRVFAPGIVSVPDRFEYGLAVSPDGNEIYFTAETPGNGLLVVRRVDDVWDAPFVPDLRGQNTFEYEAFFTADGKRLYFCSAIDGDKDRIFCSEKGARGWNKAELLDSPINSRNVFWPTVAANGTMYYTDISSRPPQIWKAKSVKGKYPETERVGLLFAHPFIAPDESFMLMDKAGDIYVGFHRPDNTWTVPVMLGKTVNSPGPETCASLSPDGKYLFFSRYNDTGNKSDIYWVSSGVIEQVKIRRE